MSWIHELPLDQPIPCPRCGVMGLPVIDGDTIEYGCGSIFDTRQARMIRVHCDSVPLTPELAFKEAQISHHLIATNEVQHKVNKEFPDDITFRDTIHRVVREPQQYLFWQSDILLQVFGQAQDFIGATVPFTQKMSQIWVYDPAIIMRETVMLMATYFRADKDRLFMAHVQNDLLKGPEDESAIEVEWYCPYTWGEPVENILQAQAAAVYTWLQQPYVAQVEAIQHSRQVKRQAERKGQILKNINVIQFRKPEGTTTQHTEGDSGRELHCCFERAGHTRRQPYGPKNGLRRIQWIAPTFVGDPSKPFKTKGQTLYRVSR